MSEDNELIAPCGCRNTYDPQDCDDFPPSWLITGTYPCADHLARLEAKAKSRAASQQVT